MKKLVFIVLMLAIVGGGVGYYMWNKPRPKVENTKGMQISAQQLSKEYSTDEAAANLKYLSKDHDKAIEVSGTVAEIENDQDGGVMVILASDDPTTGVQCAMREKGIAVSKGAQLTIKGYCSGNGITGVSLTDCILMK